MEIKVKSKTCSYEIETALYNKTEISTILISLSK